jgi:hypothetical protein
VSSTQGHQPTIQHAHSTPTTTSHITETSFHQRVEKRGALHSYRCDIIEAPCTQITTSWHVRPGLLTPWWMDTKNWQQR